MMHQSSFPALIASALTWGVVFVAIILFGDLIVGSEPPAPGQFVFYGLAASSIKLCSDLVQRRRQRRAAQEHPRDQSE